MGNFRYGKTGSNKTKYPTIIKENQCQASGKVGSKKGINTPDVREVASLGW